MPPDTRYARSGDVGIAYQVFGDGEMDLVLAFPFLSHLDLMWESPALSHFLRRLGSFARVLVFDRRGVGLSDPVARPATLEERMDDVRAVMDAAGSERAALLGMSEGATMCMLFAATYPERTSALVLWGAMARSTAAPDYPWAPEKEAVLEAQAELVAPLWGRARRSRSSRRAWLTILAPVSSRLASSARRRVRCGSGSWSRCSSTPTCAGRCP
jgi:pimeloyl-ACP methyl ester carboxylesterase